MLLSFHEYSGAGTLNVKIENSQFENNSATGTNGTASGLYVSNTEAGRTSISAQNSMFTENLRKIQPMVFM